MLENTLRLVTCDMRILLVCYDSPLNRGYGAGLRTNNIWQALGRVGDVSTLVMEPSTHTALDATPRESEIGRIRFNKPPVPWTTPETRKIRRLVSQVAEPGRFDVVVVRYLRLAMLVQGSVAAPTVVDGDDLDKVAPMIGKSFARRQFDAAKTTARRVVTHHALASFDHVWYVNPLDMRKFPARSGSVLPNVTDAPPTVLPRAKSQPPCVLMVGKFGYAPNTEGVEFFIGRVLPALRRVLPSSRLRLVGQCPPELAQRWRSADGVEVAGFVGDLAPEYASASLVIAPVFGGGGTQIKVIEALGHGCGTVVSEFAASGFAPNLQDGVHLLVARDRDEWVRQSLRLLTNSTEAERLGQAGRQVVMQTYSFDRMAREIDATISRVVSGGVG